MKRISVGSCLLISFNSYAACTYDANCLNNPYGAGSQYESDGLKNP